MNRNKEGETGRSECEVTKTRYLEAEELRDLGPDGKAVSNQIASCGMYNPHSVLRRSLLTSLPLFSGAQFRSI